MQDIFTSLTQPESEPSQDAVRHRGNVHGSDFDGCVIKIGAVAFYGEYVGAVLTASFSPVVPIQLIENDAVQRQIPLRLKRVQELYASDAVKHRGFSPPRPYWRDRFNPTSAPGLPPRDTRREKEKRSYALNLNGLGVMTW